MKKSTLILMVLVFLTTFVSSLAFAAQATTGEKEVVMIGIGTTEDKAKQQAYRSAIQSVIGAMVLSETIVENESLVRDKILSHSDGYVVKATQIGATRQLEGGLLEVTMRITVKSEQLKAKLQSENITMASMDGQSLFAQKSTQAQAKQDAAGIIKEKVKALPASVLMAVADVPKSTQKDMGGGNLQLTIPIKLSVDTAHYKTLITDLKSTLGKLGFKSKNVSVPLHRGGKSYAAGIDFDELIYAHTGRISLDDRVNHNLLVMADLINPKTARCVSYLVPKDAAMAFQKKGSIGVKVELLDASGTALVTQEWTNTTRTRVDNHERHNVAGGVMGDYRHTILAAAESDGQNNLSSVACIFPTPIFAQDLRGAAVFEPAEFHFSITFDLTDEELKSITSVKCTVINTERKE